MNAPENKNVRRPLIVLTALGVVSLIPYGFALHLQDLRANTIGFEIAFFAAFVLYILAVAFVLRGEIYGRSPASRSPRFAIRHPTLAIIFAFAALSSGFLILTPPTLSDDMYRYVWDGRVQAYGINPYEYAPGAPQLVGLRDQTISAHINRPNVVTVYPAGAELAYAAIWRLVPDNVHWFQLVMAAASLAGGVLLIALLRALGKPDYWVLIYLWNPLLIFETAHSAHVDGLVLPLLIAAWLTRAKGRDVWTGVFLGAATALKLYPALLLPALWRWRDDEGRLRPTWQMPLAFAAAFTLPYVPYLALGRGVIGFLPEYLNERFNMGLAGIVTDLIERPPAPIFQTISHWAGGSGSHVANFLMLGALAIIGLALVVRPAANGEQAIRRSIWMIGAFTLLTQNLFPWYMLWLLPLLALFLRSGKLGFAFDAWTGWFLFSGLVALAYTFFITWHPVDWAVWLEFFPLYLFLILPIARTSLNRFRTHSPISGRHNMAERNA